MKKSVTCIFGLIAVIVLVFIDQFTKKLAVAGLKGQEDFVLIKDVFMLHYLENQGAAFGMLQNKQTLFYIGTILIMIIVAIVYFRLPLTKRFIPLHVIAVLIISGAAGNLIDRLVNKYVVDFFYFELINFPVFNVADIYVTGGAIAFVVYILFYYKEKDWDLVFRKEKNKTGNQG